MSSIATGMHKNSNTVRGVIFIAADTMKARVMKLRNREIVVAVLVVLLLPIYIFNKFSESFLLEKNKEQTVTETMIAVLQSNDKVVSLPLEEYILGVVLQEMPAEFELEALKAQAVAARTYTLTKRNHQNADICTDPTCCQAYCEVSHYKGTKANLDKVQSAVRETSGQILTYEGQPIEATYFSCSGGRTEDAAAVWGSNVPYLQSVESPGEESSVNYISTKKFSAKDFSDKFDGLTGVSGTWIGAVTYTKGGGVETIVIGDKTYTGTQVRKLLGLRSTAFQITAVGDTVTVTAKGYGHRVGMSQYGADAMALKGATYQEILAHYYPGTVLSHYD